MSSCMYESHRVIATFGARHDQAWIQSVALCFLVPLPRLVHMCSHTLNLLAARSDCGFNANSVVLNGLNS